LAKATAARQFRFHRRAASGETVATVAYPVFLRTGDLKKIAVIPVIAHSPEANQPDYPTRSAFRATM
jgi:hypothetical protein